MNTSQQQKFQERQERFRRKQALNWWNHLNSWQKQYICNNYTPINGRNYSTLTGREIEDAFNEWSRKDSSIKVNLYTWDR